MHSAPTMYGRIGKISAVSRQRDALAAFSSAVETGPLGGVGLR